jgi:hypothetical protein
MSIHRRPTGGSGRASWRYRPNGSAASSWLGTSLRASPLTRAKQRSTLASPPLTKARPRLPRVARLAVRDGDGRALGPHRELTLEIGSYQTAWAMAPALSGVRLSEARPAHRHRSAPRPRRFGRCSIAVHAVACGLARVWVVHGLVELAGLRPGGLLPARRPLQVDNGADRATVATGELPDS